MDQHMIDVQAVQHCICNGLAIIAALIAARKAGKSHEVSKENRAKIDQMQAALGAIAEQHSPEPVIKIDGGLVVIQEEEIKLDANPGPAPVPLEK